MQEAMLCGTTVVATRLPAVTETLLPPSLVPRLTFEIGDAEGLRDTLKPLVAGGGGPGGCESRRRLRGYGERLRKRAQALFGLDRMIDSYSSLFHNLGRQLRASRGRDLD